MRLARAARTGLGVGGAVLAIAGCGGGGGTSSAQPLAWTAPPQVFRTTALPNDRVAVGTVRNTTTKTVRLDASRLRVLAADGTRLRSTGQYAAGYAHGLYGAFQKPDPIPPGELARLGLEVTIAPGKTAPLAVSWSLPRGSDPTRPASVDYGPGRLTLPTRVRQAAGGL